MCFEGSIPEDPGDELWFLAGSTRSRLRRKPPHRLPNGLHELLDCPCRLGCLPDPGRFIASKPTLASGHVMARTTSRSPPTAATRSAKGWTTGPHGANLNVSTHCCRSTSSEAVGRPGVGRTRFASRKLTPAATGTRPIPVRHTVLQPVGNAHSAAQSKCSCRPR